MGKADYKKRELMDNEQDALLEYKELVGAHNAGNLKYDVDTGSFNCDSGTAVLFWTECPKLPNYLSISEVLWN